MRAGRIARSLVAATSIAAAVVVAAPASPVALPRLMEDLRSVTEDGQGLRGAGGDAGSIVYAGDICSSSAACTNTGDRVEDELAAGAGLVATGGDNDQTSGLLMHYRSRFEPNWGTAAIDPSLFPTQGNHDCWSHNEQDTIPPNDGRQREPDDPALQQAGDKIGCADAVTYFGTDAAIVARIDANTDWDATDITGADVPPFTYYAEQGNWIIVVLNSAGDGEGPSTRLANAGSMSAASRSAQDAALGSVLSASSATCEIVSWHHTRYGSAENGSNDFTDPWFETAYAAGVDLALAGHSHVYERFGLQDGDGTADADGVRTIVVGTGGVAPDPDPGVYEPNSQALIADNGILVLDLGPTRYGWAFKDDVTSAVEDAGSTACH